MKILFITESFPYPLNSGGKIVSYQMLNMLSMKHEVHLVALTNVKPDKKTVHKINSLGVHTHVVVSKKRNAWYKQSKFELLSAFLHLQSPVISQFYEKNAEVIISNLLAHERFDVIHIEHLSMAQYLPKEKKAIWILQEQNIEHKLFYDFYHVSRWFSIEKILHLYNAIMLSLYERHILRCIDQVIVLSQKDKHTLTTLGVPSKKILVIPPYTTSNSANADRTRRKNELLFIGNFWWKPNMDAIVWFCRTILPLIRKVDHSVSLTIIGEGVHMLNQYFSEIPSVTLLTQRQNISRYLKYAGIFILPFRIGQGIRIKALTAFSYGLPVVSTAIGMRGLQVHTQKEYLEANNPQAFANQVLMLIRRPALRLLLASRAKRFLQTQHNRAVIQRYLQNHYGK